MASRALSLLLLYRVPAHPRQTGLRSCYLGKTVGYHVLDCDCSEDQFLYLLNQICHQIVCDRRHSIKIESLYFCQALKAKKPILA